jgi:hypothetical protein
MPDGKGCVMVACGGFKHGQLSYMRSSIKITRRYTAVLKGMAIVMKIANPDVSAVFSYCRKQSRVCELRSSPEDIYETLSIKDKLILMKGGTI